jgi:hypothetical protein
VFQPMDLTINQDLPLLNPETSLDKCAGFCDRYYLLNFLFVWLPEVSVRAPASEGESPLFPKYRCFPFFQSKHSP